MPLSNLEDTGHHIDTYNRGASSILTRRFLADLFFFQTILFSVDV